MKLKDGKALVTHGDYLDLKNRKQILTNHEGEYFLYRGCCYLIVKLFEFGNFKINVTEKTISNNYSGYSYVVTEWSATDGFDDFNGEVLGLEIDAYISARNFIKNHR